MAIITNTSNHRATQCLTIKGASGHRATNSRVEGTNCNRCTQNSIVSGVGLNRAAMIAVATQQALQMDFETASAIENGTAPESVVFAANSPFSFRYGLEIIIENLTTADNWNGCQILV